MELVGSFATDEYLEDPWFGRLRLSPDCANLDRVEEDFVRLLNGHDVSLVLGTVRKAWFDEGTGYYMAEIYVPDVPGTQEYRDMVDEGIRGLTSVGAVLTGITLTYVGDTYAEDKWDADWELVEISDVGAPLDKTRLSRPPWIYDEEKNSKEDKNGD